MERGEALDQGADAKGSLRESVKNTACCTMRVTSLTAHLTSCHQDITRLTSHFTHQSAHIQSDALPPASKKKQSKEATGQSLPDSPKARATTQPEKI